MPVYDESELKVFHMFSKEPEALSRNIRLGLDIPNHILPWRKQNFESEIALKQAFIESFYSINVTFGV